MAYTSDELWLTANAGDGTNNKFESTAPPNADQGVADFGTSTAFRWLQLPRSGTTSGAGFADPQEGVDGGFNIMAAEMHDGGATHSRLIKAGVWTFEFLVTNEALDTTNGYSEAVYVYRRAAGGGLTMLFSVTAANHTIVELITAYTLTSASQPKYLFAPGETLQIEYWARGKGIAILGQSRTLRRGSTLAGDSVVTLPGGGIFNSFSRANSDVAPASDTMDEQYAADRPISDATTLTESPAREVIVARSVGDAVTATDNLGRVLLLPRELADNAPVTDGGAVRALALGREMADAVTGLDALSLAFAGFRQIADTTALSESPARQFVGARPLSDSAPTTADDLVRVVTANRDVDDTIITADSMARATVVDRALSDNAPAVDTLARAINANRGIEDNLTTGGGAITYRSVMVFED